jgi:hypothetical protein
MHAFFSKVPYIIVDFTATPGVENFYFNFNEVDPLNAARLLNIDGSAGLNADHSYTCPFEATIAADLTNVPSSLIEAATSTLKYTDFDDPEVAVHEPTDIGLLAVDVANCCIVSSLYSFAHTSVALLDLMCLCLFFRPITNAQQKPVALTRRSTCAMCLLAMKATVTTFVSLPTRFLPTLSMATTAVPARPKWR